MNETEFQPFPKIARLNREIVITEKIDGTNAQILIDESGNVRAGSRTRYIDIHNDNYGFANWVKAHEDELRSLGPGRHFGEWWGVGINRNYGLTERRFSLFNTGRWVDPRTKTLDTVLEPKQEFCPMCCHVVPVLYKGAFCQNAIWRVEQDLRFGGSKVVPGFMKPEGVVVYHTAANQLFKVTLEKDEQPKGLA